MFIQLKDINDVEQKTESIFIIKEFSNDPLYISRSFADHSIRKFTSKEKLDSIVYFNKQATVEAISTAFRYTGLSLEIERIAVNSESKIAAKQADSIKKLNKSQRHKEMKKGH